MTIKVVEEKGEEEWELYSQKLTAISGEKSLKFILSQDEPEDMIFGRSLPFIDEVVALMKMAHEAGKNGDDMNIIFEEDAK